jgi:PAS domain S-box-containing protein
MGKPLRVLMVEDSEDDVLLTVRALKKGGYDPVFARVEDAGAMRKALQKKTWDIILCDYQMPQFNSLAAIALLKEAGIDIPLIIVSGAIGEETAVECMRLGARDYVMKDKLSRLVPSIERELKEAESRSKRRQAEKALRENEERFRRVSSMISDVAYSCSMKEDGLFSIDWMEGGAERISGYSIEEIKAQKCWRFLVIDEDLTLFDENVTGLSPGLYASCELRIQHKSGAIAWVESYAECVRMETPESFVLYGALVDITDRKRAEETLKGSEEKYRSLFENANEAIFVVQDGKLVFLNPMTAMLTGYSAEELMSRPFVEFIHPDDRDMVIDRHVMRLKGEEIPHLYSFQIIHKDGNVRWVELNAILIHWAGKLSTLNFLSDITELRQLRAVMEENALKYRVLFENQLNGLAYCKIVVNENNQPVDYIFLEINNAFEEHTGLKKKDVLGRRITEIIPGFEKSTFDFIGVHGRVALTGEAVKFEQYQERLRRWYSVFVYSPKEGYFVSIFSDITDRKRTEVELVESKALIEAVVENVPLMIFLKEATDLRFVIFNRAGEELLGYDRSDLMGKNNLELFPPEQAAHFMAKDREVLDGETGMLDIPEESIQTAKKGERFLHTRKVCIRGSDGVTKFLLGISEDITDRKRYEESLRSSERRLSDIIEFFPDATLVIDKEGKVVAWNRAIETMTGVKAEDMLGKGDYEYALPFYGERRPILIDLALNPKPEKDKSYNHIQRMGDILFGEAYTPGLIGSKTHLSATASVLRNSEGEIVAAIECIRDDTGRRKAQEELRQAEERYRSIFENAQEGIFRSTPEGKIILANPAMAKMFGYASSEELITGITDAARQLYVDPEERTKIRKLIEAQGNIRNHETQFYKKDGSIIWVSMTMQAVRDEKGQLLYYEGMDEDITVRKESADRMRKALGATVQAISVTVETRDPYTAGHQKKVADLSRAIATEMNLSADQIDGIRMAAIIHDLGKISVPAEILSKPTKLTALEFSLIKTHAQSGYDILKNIDFPWPIARVVLEHHERMDGSGYPNGLTGNNILLESRILSVADVVESMGSHRPYRPSLGVDTALAEIEQNRGTHYDPAVADACLRLFREKGFQLEGV